MLFGEFSEKPAETMKAGAVAPAFIVCGESLALSLNVELLGMERGVALDEDVFAG